MTEIPNLPPRGSSGRRIVLRPEIDTKNSGYCGANPGSQARHSFRCVVRIKFWITLSRTVSQIANLPGQARLEEVGDPLPSTGGSRADPTKHQTNSSKYAIFFRILPVTSPEIEASS
jgi:hypothetical protein